MNGCLCGGCRDCLRAQGCDEDGEAVDKVAANLLKEWMTDADKIGEAQMILDDEWDAINAAHAAINAEPDPARQIELKARYFDLMDAAVSAVLGMWADEKARERLEKIRREAEQDAFEMAMED
jgi:hypothetical protein